MERLIPSETDGGTGDSIKAAGVIVFLIDGYNLLNASGVESAPGSPRTPELDRARQGLLDFLAEALTAEEVLRTMVVFDAHGPRSKRVVEECYRGLIVRFAVQYPDADTLLEQLIAQHTSPKQLTVVSSDHRVQRAARRRRAKFIDSEVWYAALCRRLRNRRQEGRQVGRDTCDRLEAEDVESWLRKFGLSKAEAEKPITAEGGALAASRPSQSRPRRGAPNRQGEPGGAGRNSPREFHSARESLEAGNPEDATSTASLKADNFSGEGVGDIESPIAAESLTDFGLSEADLQKPIEAWEAEAEPRGEKPIKARDSRRPPRR